MTRVRTASASKSATRSKNTLLLLYNCLVSLCLIHAEARAEPGEEKASLQEEIVVTATRVPTNSLDLFGNIAKVDRQALRTTNATHMNEIAVQVPGAWVSRNSGQEQLTALRSPVLTGPGSCGSFLMMEDGIAIRPTGFCNVNQMFEVPTEQAGAVEVMRGPANAVYGSNGLHGTINTLMPSPGDSDGVAASLEAGPNDFWRAQFGWDNGQTDNGVRLGLVGTTDGGFRDDSGYDQYKGFLRSSHEFASGNLLTGLTFTDLDQETAGFIRGEDAYKDPDLRTTNPNPEAYRDANAQRLYARWLPTGTKGPWNSAWTGYLRHSDMDFLQHFLPGQPTEENGQVSGGVMLDAQRRAWRDSALSAGFIVELTDGYLEEFQDQDLGPDSSRPTGQHYDYDVTSFMIAPYAQLAVPFAERWEGQIGLRMEYLVYDYENNMLSGNTRDDGTECTNGCLFYRPEDRSDDFFNVAPNLGLRYRINETNSLFANLTRGFRVPQATELYRLQAEQQVDDIDSVTIDSAELGWRRVTEQLRFEAVGFVMRKRDYIFRDADGFNVSDGKSNHYGVEGQLRWQPGIPVYLSLVGSWAKHEYDFDRDASRGEKIRSGNEVDTSPQVLASARVGYENRWGLAELEWVHTDPYFLDAANTARYDGHDLLNLRVYLTPVEDWTLGVRVNNLTDERYADRADFAFGSYRYFPGREREVYVEVAYRRL